MARNRGKKALYEVMSKARSKHGFGKTLEQMSQKKSDEKQAEPVKENIPAEKHISVKKRSFAVDSTADIETTKNEKFWRKSRAVQFNGGRIDFSMPYQLAVALVLGFVLLILAAFRLGQVYYLTDQRATGPAEEMPKFKRTTPIGQEMTDIKEPPAQVEDSTLPDTKELEPVTPKATGNNVIVVQQWGARADLEPVQEHFAEYGIETEIVVENGRYFLQTKNRYDNNPSTAGTDGYKALQEIIKVGAEYKAPPDNEPFTRHLFSDAYGKKVK